MEILMSYYNHYTCRSERIKLNDMINENDYATNKCLSIENILVINENLDICFSILPNKHIKPNITKEERIEVFNLFKTLYDNSDFYEESNCISMEFLTKNMFRTLNNFEELVTIVESGLVDSMQKEYPNRCDESFVIAVRNETILDGYDSFKDTLSEDTKDKIKEIYKTALRNINNCNISYYKNKLDFLEKICEIIDEEATNDLIYMLLRIVCGIKFKYGKELSLKELGEEKFLKYVKEFEYCKGTYADFVKNLYYFEDKEYFFVALNHLDKLFGSSKYNLTVYEKGTEIESFINNMKEFLITHNLENHEKCKKIFDYREMTRKEAIIYNIHYISSNNLASFIRGICMFESYEEIKPILPKIKYTIQYSLDYIDEFRQLLYGQNIYIIDNKEIAETILTYILESLNNKRVDTIKKVVNHYIIGNPLLFGDELGIFRDKEKQRKDLINLMNKEPDKYQKILKTLMEGVI